MVVNGKEYYLSKSPVKIVDNDGKSYDTSNVGKFAEIHPNYEFRVYSFLTAIDSKVNLQTKDLDITLIHLMQSCSDCWVDSYCAYECSEKPVCSWSKGCVARSLDEDSSYTKTPSHDDL